MDEDVVALDGDDARFGDFAVCAARGLEDDVVGLPNGGAPCKR